MVPKVLASKNASAGLKINESVGLQLAQCDWFCDNEAI